MDGNQAGDVTRKGDEDASEKGAARPKSGNAEEDSATLGPESSRADFSRPHSSSSGRRATSRGSDVVFETKKKKRKATAVAPAGYDVTFTVTITMAIPTEMEVEEPSKAKSDDDEDGPNIKDLMKKRRRTFEAPKAQGYFHVEYELVPQDDIMKTDVVTYGIAAKIFTECHDPKVIKTWQDGDITWMAWSHNHTITVNDEILMKLFDHHLELQIYNSKEKISTRARFDRPKAFRLPQAKPGEDSEDVGGVKGLVLKQYGSYTKLQPKKGAHIRPLPKTTTFDMKTLTKKEVPDKDERPQSLTDGVSAQPSASGHTLVAVHTSQSGSHDGRTFSRLGKLAGAERPVPSPAGSRRPEGSSKGDVGPASAKSLKASQLSSASVKDRNSSKSRESEGSLMQVDKNRRKRKVSAVQCCKVPIRMALLFSGIKSVTGRLESAIPGVEDAFVTVSLDKPLMSAEQQVALNPMIIKIQCATNLPEPPANSRCEPVYCNYTFFNMPEHKTSSKPHSTNIYWEDVNVVLLGTMDQSALREYLNGPPLAIEVHDRDRCREEVRLKPSLFGDDLEDEKISNVGTVTSRRTFHNAFEKRNKPWDPYGVARFDLSELLLGHSYLYLTAPIHNAPLPDVLGGTKADKLMGVAGAVDGPVDRPLTPGHYLMSNAALKIKLQLCVPLSTPEILQIKPPVFGTKGCPFGRIIYIFDYHNLDFLYNLQREVAGINARALELDEMPQHVIDAALSTYKLSSKQQVSRKLNIITGFHVLDHKWHIFVLEGLHDLGIRQIWDKLQPTKQNNVTVLYNSDLTFSERLYAPLDVDLCRIKLHEPLGLIVQQSLLYIRDMVPRPCFEALIRLDQILSCRTMKEVLRNNLLPTADQVVSMSKEFGVPFTAEDLLELKPKSAPATTEGGRESQKEAAEPQRPHTTRDWTPIDNFNPNYMEKLEEADLLRASRNFIADNIENVHRISEVSRMEHQRLQRPMVSSQVERAHNYSIQTLNSSELAMDGLRQILAKEPDTRFTYCQDYLHRTVLPVNLEALKKKEKLDSVSKWRTPTGWSFPGKKTTLESNYHSRHPDPARVEELRQRWSENFLHTNILEPPLDRDPFPWPERRADFELYQNPLPDFGSTPVHTIMESGLKLKKEKDDAKAKDRETWKSKLVVENVRPHHYRLLPATEMRDRGQQSSNQIDRLRGMLKSAPVKFSLKVPGLRLQEIPSLGVMMNPSVDTEARAKGVKLPPAFDPRLDHTRGYNPGPYAHSWAFSDNHIPAFDYQHDVHSLRNGADFNLFLRDRTRLWKRPIGKLRQEEMENHLFRIPEDCSFFLPAGPEDYPQPPASPKPTADPQTGEGIYKGQPEVPAAIPPPVGQSMETAAS